MKIITLITFLFFCAAMPAAAADQKIISDTIKTSGGDLVISVLGHGSLMMSYGSKVVHIDPFSTITDYAAMPKASIILITHEHRDHLDLNAIENIKTPQTKIIGPEEAAKQLPGIIVMKNGDTWMVDGLKIEALPAYNLVHMRSPGTPYHIKGIGNGYIITFGDKRVYVAGDQENTPEMKQLKNIDIAFLPMNLPFTMTPEMVADAVKAFKPKIVYPYHHRFGETDIPKLEKLLKGLSDTELRVRQAK